MIAVTTSLKIDVLYRISLKKMYLVCFGMMFSSFLHIMLSLTKPWTACDALQPTLLTLTHRGGWAAANPELRSAWSFLPPLPHQNFRQCQTTSVQFLLRQQLLDCSKQCVQSQHRAGESTAVCTCVSRCFKPCRREWGQRLVIKSKEHKILSNTHTTPFRKHFHWNYYYKAILSISTNRKLKKDIMHQDTLYEICYIAYASTVKISAKGPWDGSS